MLPIKREDADGGNDVDNRKLGRRFDIVAEWWEKWWEVYLDTCLVYFKQRLIIPKWQPVGELNPSFLVENQMS